MLYKFVVVSMGFEAYKYIFKQLGDRDDSCFINRIPDSRIGHFWLNFIYHPIVPGFIKKISRNVCCYFYVRVLFQKIKEKKWDVNSKICFLLLSGGTNQELLKADLHRKIKNKFPNSKIVFYCGDLVETTKKPIDKIKEAVDLVYTCDFGDAGKYDLLQKNAPYSDITFDEKFETKYDICFIGQAKNRLDKILSAYEYFRSNDVKCCFVLINTPKDKQKWPDEIRYCDSIPYYENLRIIKQSKCILEILQGGGTNITERTNTAIMFDKKLISNNPYLKKYRLFDPRYMKIFEDIKDIDADFIKSNENVDYADKELLYPIRFLEEIDSELARRET